MANADTLEGAGVNSGNALDAAKVQQNSETTKDKESKKHCHRRTTEHELNRVANSSSSRRLESRFPVVIGVCLRPSQTCESTREYLFRTLQLKSCFPPIISGMPRQTKAPGTSYSALNSAAKIRRKIGIITIFLLKSWYYTHFSGQNLT